MLSLEKATSTSLTALFSCRTQIRSIQLFKNLRIMFSNSRTPSRQPTLWQDRARSLMPAMMSRSTSKLVPAHHANDSGTLFKNPWPSAGKATWTELLQRQNPLSWYNNHDLAKHKRAREVNVVSPDWGESSLTTRELKKENAVVGTWLGHAGAMIELPISGVLTTESGEKRSLWVLFDPMFSQRAGPNQYAGPGRFKNSPCEVTDLPACDAVVISHNHYDHMDYSSIKAIVQKFPQCKYFVPLGNKSWVSSLDVPEEQIFELDWWESCLFDEKFEIKKENSKDDPGVRFTCVPAQHNSGRGTWDQGNTLWCGWVVEQLLDSNDETSSLSNSGRKRKGAIYHAGDTGYRRTNNSDEICPAFEEIGKKFGPFDLSFIPIWRGGTLGFVSSIGLRLSHNDIPQTFHASPADAVAIHRDVNSNNTVGVHFGTFIGSENESYEAIIEFDEAREKQGVQDLNDLSECKLGRVGVLDIGGSVAIEI